MTRYIIIDDYSGLIWGDKTAESPEAACRLMDEDIGGEPRRYFDGPNHGGQFYRCHEAPDNFPKIEDGQSESQIEAVCKLPLAAKIGWETSCL